MIPASDLERMKGAHIDFAMTGARVHTFQAKGLLGFLLAIVVLAGIAVVVALVFTFALGVGLAVTAATAVLAALGVGFARVQRRLPPRRHRELANSDH